VGNGVVLTPRERLQLGEPVSGGGADPAVRAPDDGLGLDLANIVRIIREWRWLILGAIALGRAAGIVVTLLTTPRYRASATLEANPPVVEILDERTREAGSSPASWDFIATQVGLLSSRSLAERVAQDLNLAANTELVGTGGDAKSRLATATGIVAGGIQVETPKEGSLIRFTYDSTSPQLAAQVANGIADSFIASGLQRRFEASAYARKFLEAQIAKTRAELERTERELVAYAQAQGIINTGGAEGQTPGDTNSLQGESLVALNRALADATARRVQAAGAYQQARAAGGTAEVNVSTQGLRQTRATLEAEYQDKRTLMKPDHPDMLSLRSRIDEIARQINSERSQVASGRATTLLNEYRAAVSSENALRGRVAQLKGSVLDLRGRSIRYNILQRDVDTNRGLYDALLQRYKEVGVGGGVGTSPISIVDRAEVPGAPYKPNVMFNVLAGLVGGLLAGLGLAIALEFMNDTIKTRDDVRSKLGLACLGVIPKRRGTGPMVNDLEDAASPMSEAYSAVTATLRFSAETGAPKNLLVTSAQPAEGKSTSTLALARNYARRGEKVLIIDADLRRPAFRGLSKNEGLVQLLTSDAQVREHVVNTNYENLWLLPCGPIAPNPADLLSTGRFAEIIKEAGQFFDRIIIDGPPILGLADAGLLAAVAEGTMVVIEAGRTRTGVARNGIERIKSAGARIVGVTLTKSTQEASQYGYRQYQYGGVNDKRKEMILISQQPEA
jgi:capsular exopolysaccharide synthesis family protein